MANYKLTNKAVEDLSKIWDFTYEFWSENQANKYYFKLLEDCQTLAENQNLGKILQRLIIVFLVINLANILYSSEELVKKKLKSLDF